MRNDVVENKIMAKAKFLKWYKLDDATMDAMGHTNKHSVYISPDVLSLHIVWVIDGEAEHEIADYPDSYDYTEVAEWLETEVFDDCYGPVDIDEDIFDGQKIEDIPEINFVVNTAPVKERPLIATMPGLYQSEIELLPGAVAEYCLANFPSRIVAIKTLRNDYGSDWAHLSYCIGNLKTVYPLYVSPPNTVSHRDVHPDNFEEDNPQVEHIDTLRDIQRRMLDLLDELKDCSREIERNGNEGTAARLNSYVIAHLECAVTSEHSWLDSSTSIDSIIEELEEA